jgi:hypothetical protein
MPQPPEGLLQEGPAENVVSLEVRVCVDAVGCVWSIHRFASPEDEAKARAWAGGGVRQIAHALLTEAVRREVFTCALVEMTRDPDFLAKFLADPKNQEAVEKRLGEGAVEVLRSTAARLAPGVARETLNMMISQMTVGSGGANPPGMG